MERRFDSLSLAEFLAWEQNQEERHQLIGGEVVAFSGGSLDHDRICGNVYIVLASRLRAPCRVYGSNVITETLTRKGKNGPRADVVVTCSPEDAGLALSVKHPRVVFEVLSPGNTGARWTAKTFEYWNTPAIVQFVVIDATQRSVESYVRDETGSWLPVMTHADASVVALHSVGVELSVAEIYRGTSLDSEPPR